MTAKNLAQRLARIEAQQRGPAKIVICWCPDGEQHRPDCEAAGADDGEDVWVTWLDSGFSDD